MQSNKEHLKNIHKVDSSKDIFGYITLISTLCSLIIFIVALVFYSRTAQIITFFVTLGFVLGSLLYRLKKPLLTTIYMTTIPPLMFGVLIVLVGGNFNQGLGIATSTFLSFIVFKDRPKTRVYVIGFDLLMYVLPTIYINIYGPVLGTLNLAYDEIIVFIACLCWLSLTFFMYDEKKTRGYTDELESKNEFLKATADELIQVQNHLTVQNKKLFELNNKMILKTKQIEDFTNMVSHDLKAPINNINSIAKQLQLQLKDSNNEETENYLNYLQICSKRMSNLVHSLLENAKIGNSVFEKEVCFKGLIESIVEDFSERIKNVHAELKICELPVIDCYPNEIRLLFQNLLDNALKFVSENRPPVICISCEQTDGFYKFSISDNGIGISEENIKTIFQAFQKIHPEQKYEGSGIGLYGCKKVVDHHGGDICVESKINVGTTFHFTIATPDFIKPSSN